MRPNKSKTLLLSFATIFITSTPMAAPVDSTRTPLHFEKNIGQHDMGVKALSRGADYSFALLANEVALSLKNKAGKHASVRFSYIGANDAPGIVFQDKYPAKANYFKGNDQKRWRSGIDTFAKVEYTNLYHGIDALFYGNEGEVEYDLVVHPGASPSAIAFEISGADAVRLTESGDLNITVAGVDLIQKAPISYQIINKGSPQNSEKIVR